MEMQPGQMAYDRASTVFSPDGRLFQVEYALQAIQMGGTAVAVTYNGGIVFVAYRNLPVSSLAEATSIEKSFAIDTGLGCVTAGLIADSRVLVEFLRLEAQRHRILYGEVAPFALLAHTLGTHLQQFTQFGGTRPFATWDYRGLYRSSLLIHHLQVTGNAAPALEHHVLIPLRFDPCRLVGQAGCGGGYD